MLNRTLVVLIIFLALAACNSSAPPSSNDIPASDNSSVNADVQHLLPADVVRHYAEQVVPESEVLLPARLGTQAPMPRPVNGIFRPTSGGNLTLVRFAPGEAGLAYETLKAQLELGGAVTEASLGERGFASMMLLNGAQPAVGILFQICGDTLVWVERHGGNEAASTGDLLEQAGSWGKALEHHLTATLCPGPTALRHP
jgi:hypothetical protein